MICIQCGAEFSSKRTSAKYCSNRCKQINKRVSVSEEGVSVSDLSPEETVSVSESLSVSEVDVSVTTGSGIEKEVIIDHPEELDMLVVVLREEGKTIAEINAILEVHLQDLSEGRRLFIPNRVLQRMEKTK